MFGTARELHQKIDDFLKGPKWICKTITIEGDELDANRNPLTEEVNLWRQDSLEGVGELIGKPSIKDMLYCPEKHFWDSDSHKQIISQSNTVSGWWEAQQGLPKGATVVPLIIGSDTTHISVFSGGKSAWSVYLMIGNILKADWQCPSKQMQFLLDYLPITKMKIFTNNKTRQVILYRLFHCCMQLLLGPLYDFKEKELIEIVCCDSGNALFSCWHMLWTIWSSVLLRATRRVPVPLAMQRLSITEDVSPA